SRRGKPVLEFATICWMRTTTYRFCRPSAANTRRGNDGSIRFLELKATAQSREVSSFSHYKHACDSCHEAVLRFDAKMVTRKAPLPARPRFLHGLAGIWDQKTIQRRKNDGFCPGNVVRL